MALSFAEKRPHQKALKDATIALRGGSLGFKEKRQYQTQKKDALKVLKGLVAKGSDVVADLIAGKFNNLVPAKFREKLVEVSTLDHDFDAVKKATADYLEKQFDGSPLLESVADIDPAQAETIAKEAHDRLGKLHSQFIPWEELAPEKSQYAIEAVQYIAGRRDATPAQIHDHWAENRRANGWVYAPELDQDKKTHPSLVDFRELDQAEKDKDRQFLSAVLGLLEEPQLEGVA